VPEAITPQSDTKLAIRVVWSMALVARCGAGASRGQVNSTTVPPSEPFRQAQASASHAARNYYSECAEAEDAGAEQG
jgi:hypothetical protein